MLRATFFALAATTLVNVALAVQVPLDSIPDERHRADDDFVEWNLSDAPNPNATDHLVFETVHSLLQHWPNTRMRNGHNIVPGIIPNGTLLYHGRANNVIPTGPEWIATDPEHSYIFSRNMLDRSQRGGWHLTLMATRPLKLIYFDGSSAVKLPFGSMDTQDLMTTGKASTGRNLRKEESERVHYLCKWGKEFGVDGFIRMEMDFEIIYCDFTAGLSVVSMDHLVSQWSGPFRFSPSEFFESMHSGSWHNRFPGETRIQLDLPRMVSFYDTELAPSLVPIRFGQERWDHRAFNISSDEFAAVKSRLESNLLRPDGASSGIDWKTLFQVIVDRYAGRLKLMRGLLNSSPTNLDELLDLAEKTQAQLRIMLTPYFLFSATPTDPSNESELDWAIPIYHLCSTVHTRSMESRFESMTDSEKMLLRAVRGTGREICRTVTKMWATGVYAGVDPVLNAEESLEVANVARVRDTWAEELERLMSWLDWSVWVNCDPGCAFEDTCYLPTWPIGFPWVAKNPIPGPWPIDDDDDVPDQDLASLALRNKVMENVANQLQHSIRPEPDEWIRPEPKCIRRIKPYTY